ncbi:MAG: TonB-dependent receptor domain-containing protein, partial [Terriglobia bacterium]
RGLALGYTHTFNPTMVNELRLGFSRKHYDDNVPAYGQHYPPPSLQVPGVPNNPSINGLTWFGFNLYHGIGEPTYTPTLSTSQEFQINDTLSIVRGKHTIKTGPQFRRSQFNLLQIGQPRGNLFFSGQFTQEDPGSSDGSGNSLADMLLGLPVSSKISTLTYFGNRQHVYGGFVQDDYKATPSLTLNLGLRYDYTGPIFESHNRQSNFDFATGQIIPAATAGYSRGLVTTDKYDFGPRLGFAYSPFQNHKTVIRSGYGRFFSAQEIRTGDPLQLDYNLPFFFEPTFTSDGLTPALTLATGFPSLNPSQAKLAGVTSNDWRLHTPVFDEWNFDIQRELPGQILLDVAYVGTKGTYLQVLVDHNQIPTPSPVFDQALRPYPQYGPFTSIEDHGNSSYHAFQLKAEKRTSYGLYFLSAFTYGKSIDDQPEICCSSPWPQNSYDLKAEKGLSDFDNRKRWVTSFDYALPLGTGQRFLNKNRALDFAFGGWHLGGIVTLRSGFPFSPKIGFDPSNTGSQGLLRSDRIANGNLPPGQRTPNLWFDVAAFPVPTGFQFGNSGKNVIDGPGERTADMSLRKFFTLNERFRLEFRSEFFNAFNHPVFSQPDPFITDGPGATGVITSTVIPQRQLQFALKLHF